MYAVGSAFFLRLSLRSPWGILPAGAPGPGRSGAGGPEKPSLGRVLPASAPLSRNRCEALDVAAEARRRDRRRGGHQTCAAKSAIGTSTAVAGRCGSVKLQAPAETEESGESL